MSRSLVLYLLCVHLFFSLTSESAVFKAFFGRSHSKSESGERTLSIDDVYLPPSSEDTFTFNQMPSMPSKSSKTEALENDSEWIDCRDFVPEKTKAFEDFPFLLQLRAIIMSCLDSEVEVLECSETLKTKLSRLEARTVPVPVYLVFFDELLQSPSPRQVSEVLLTRILAYIFERLNKTEAKDCADCIVPLIDATKFIFANGRSSELAAIALKILEHFKRLHPDLCALFYNYTLDLLEQRPEQSEASEKILKNFYLILSSCQLDDYNPRSIASFPVHFQAHYEMTRVYRILTFEDEQERRLDMLRTLPYNLGNVNLFNSHLNSTGFLITFNLDRRAVNERRKVFSELLHRCTEPMLASELIFWLLRNGFLYILEGIFIYLNSMLHGLTEEEIFELWSAALVGPEASLNLAAMIWSYVPPTQMSLEFLDALIVVWIEQNIEASAELMKAFRLVLLATDALTTSHEIPAVWRPPEKLLNHFPCEQEMQKSLHAVIVEIVQVFLARKAGLPFATTVMPRMPKEIFTWDDVLKLLNEFFEKFAEIRGLTLIPKVGVINKVSN